MKGLLSSGMRRSATLLAFVAMFLQVSPRQLQTNETSAGKSVGAELIQKFAEPEPDVYRAAIDAHKKILRAEISIDTSTTARFYEEPTSTSVYNSSISIERAGVTVANYKVGSMIKHQSLRLVHAALIRSGDSGMLVCEYEGGAVGAKEGFAILRFSAATFKLHTLPLTDFGKVVVFREKLGRVEIWSGLLDDSVQSDADDRPYLTRTCLWQLKDFACGAPKRHAGRFSPAAVDDLGIEIR